MERAKRERDTCERAKRERQRQWGVSPGNLLPVGELREAALGDRTKERIFAQQLRLSRIVRDLPSTGV